MAASDIVDAVYADAVSAVDAAATYADLIGFVRLGDEARAVVDSPAVPISTNYNVAFNIDAQPDVGTPSVAMRATPTLSSLGTLSFNEIVVPDFTEIAPELNFPAAVTVADIDAPNTRPTLDALTVPDSPDITYPTLPTLAQVVVPDDVNVVIPQFEYTFTMDRPTPPTQQFSFNEEIYSSTLLTGALALLQNDIDNGGYGLRAEDELNIWNRAKDRIAGATSTEQDEAERNIAARGFSMPPGSLNALIARSAQNKAGRMAEVNNELAIKRADLHVQARQFAITTGLNAQQFLIGFHANRMDRLLTANKYLADFGLQYYEANIRDFQAELDRYRTEATVFETKLRAALANLEVLRSKLEAARLKGQINQDQIELYNAQYRGVEALVNVYNTQLQGVRVKAELQDLKFRVYGEDIRAYVARLQAEGQKVTNYRELVNAETAKMTAFNAKVDAHNAILSGKRTSADIQKLRIDTERENAELKLKEFDAETRRWLNEYAQSVENARLILQKHGIDVGKWSDTQRLKLNEQDLRVNNQRSNVQNMLATYSFNLDKYKFTVDQVYKEYDLITKNVTNAAQVYGNLATASYNAVNAIAAIIE